ncbi:unnamed protein product [Musa acuminata var. zebrina]
MAGVDLRHILLDLLPSFDMKERCRELGIQHHLEKIIPDLWAIDAVIRDATMRAWTQPDVEMWMADAGAAIADVHNLLDRILEWPGRAAAPPNPLLRSFLSIRVAFRLSIPQELKEMGLRLKELVLWGSALDLRKEMMDAMDPCDEEYSYVLGDEVVGRDEDRDNIGNTVIITTKHTEISGSKEEDYMHMMIAEDLMPQQSFDAEKMYRLIREIELQFATLDSDYYMRTRIGQDSIRIPKQCCHLCLLVNSDDAFTFSTALSAGVIKRLRTLILQTDEEFLKEDEKCEITEIPLSAMFTNLIHLRILHLSHCRIQRLPNTIARLVSLRYLNLSYTEIQSLPKYLSNLQNLKILKLAHCEEFRKLPESIHKLRKLQILKLAYLLENLQPNLALEKLEIISYMGKKLSSWMACKKENLWHLREIKLVNLKKCERLPPLGQLPELEIVEISGMDSISAVDDAFYGDCDGDTFPRLETLIFSEMPMLERWLKAKGEGDVFPVLGTLILIQCPKFKELDNLNDVRVLGITGCEELRCLPQGIKHLKHLYRLEIIRCNNLISLPDWLAELPSIEPWGEDRIPFDLIVRDCAMLSFIPERLKPSPDFRMNIKGCPKLGV